MNNLKPIIAENLAQLRKSKGLTQAELAAKFNYSDKAVSRWERGDTLPEIDVLAELCNFYGITLDDLVQKGDALVAKTPQRDVQRAGKIIICILLISFIWLIATCLFVYSTIFIELPSWQMFVYAIPISFLALLLLTRRFGYKKMWVYLASGFIWTALASVYVYFLKYNVWLIFILGVPLQTVVFLWHSLRALR